VILLYVEDSLTNRTQLL